jgi:hypothetical protein
MTFGSGNDGFSADHTIPRMPKETPKMKKTFQFNNKPTL